MVYKLSTDYKPTVLFRAIREIAHALIIRTIWYIHNVYISTLLSSAFGQETQ